MERRKLTKEDIDKVRDIEGFPIAKDEDIIALSDAPYYTACPNPFIKEFIEENGTPYDEETDDYHCEPFAADVSEGKADPIYMAHAYHTKVPHKAIMRYILHYTKPGDIVFDGFCGTGMTGVAAQTCGTKDEKLKLQLRSEVGKDISFGERFAILNDLSPAGTFISANYNRYLEEDDFERRFQRALEETQKELGWMYETDHVENQSSFGVKGTINYVIWSDVYICSHCGSELVFWNQAVDEKRTKIKSKFLCPHCGAELSKSSATHAMELVYDDAIGESVSMAKQVPVLINYSYMGKRHTKIPDEKDLDTIKRINDIKIPYWYPVAELPEGYNTEQPKRSNGIYYVHQLYTKRNLYFLAKFYSLLDDNKLRFIFTSCLQNASKMYKYRTDGKGGIVTGTLYIPALNQENNIYNLLKNKADMIFKANVPYKNDRVLISTNSSTQEPMPSNSIDYIFTDPPFGANINYSELSFLWESWLKDITNNDKEAICNPVQHKGLVEYQRLMTQCFSEFNRVLKPNRWMTVEFHNSKNSVWNAIQEGLQRAGFIIADVRTLDKKQGSFKQVTTSTAVKQDLVISAYKPTDKFNRKVIQEAGTEETAWAFVTQHLSNLPVVVDADHNGKIDIISERQAYLLFDRMVAYHVVNGIPVPLDATDFYKGLDDRFLKRDDMYFLPDQVNEYDEARIKMDLEDVQMAFAVTNEKTAREWLTFELATPQTYAEIQPKFMQEVKAVDKYEEIPELSVLLEENFIQDDKGRWYVPDIRKEGDVAKLREKNLLKEFDGYMQSKGKLKLFRSEAIRAGFSKLWKEKNYQAIVDMAERLPEQTIQEDQNLLMYYDVSLSRVQ